ncbi:MAG: hypothetical protein JRJ64_14575, partial [Deltaproteobacteria bacterium]|nr:hypothetical protein [Deltaproteobacteria bacterium]
MFELTDTFYGNEIKIWLIALAVVRVAHLTKKTNTILDDVVVGALRKTKLLYLFIVSTFAGSIWLSLPDEVRSVFWKVTIVATIIQTGIW